MIEPAEIVVDSFADADGAPLTQAAQIRMCGNSVCPDVAAALVAANYRPSETRTPRPRKLADAPLLEAAE